VYIDLSTFVHRLVDICIWTWTWNGMYMEVELLAFVHNLVCMCTSSWLHVYMELLPPVTIVTVQQAGYILWLCTSLAPCYPCKPPCRSPCKPSSTPGTRTQCNMSFLSFALESSGRRDGEGRLRNDTILQRIQHLFNHKISIIASIDIEKVAIVPIRQRETRYRQRNANDSHTI
jgi:hypothetical protein